MQKLGFQINSHVYDGLIRAIVPERGFSSGMEIVSYINLTTFVFSKKKKNAQILPLGHVLLSSFFFNYNICICYSSAVEKYAAEKFEAI